MEGRIGGIVPSCASCGLSVSCDGAVEGLLEDNLVSLFKDVFGVAPEPEAVCPRAGAEVLAPSLDFEDPKANLQGEDGFEGGDWSFAMASYFCGGLVCGLPKLRDRDDNLAVLVSTFGGFSFLNCLLIPRDKDIELATFDPVFGRGSSSCGDSSSGGVSSHEMDCDIVSNRGGADSGGRNSAGES